MRTHILLVLITLAVSACASKNNATSFEQREKSADQYSFADQASRFR